MITLKAFVKKCGTQEKAARELNVTLRTIQRWLHGGQTFAMFESALKAKGIRIS